MFSLTEIRLVGVTRRLRALQRRGSDLRPVFRAFRKEMRSDLAEHFAKRTGSKRSWPSWSTSYLEKKARQRGSFKRREFRKTGRRVATKTGEKRLRNMLGRLRSAFAFRVTQRYLEIRSKVKWAGVHQQGGTAGRGSRIPPREFLYISREAVIEFKRIVKHFLAHGVPSRRAPLRGGNPLESGVVQRLMGGV